MTKKKKQKAEEEEANNNIMYKFGEIIIKIAYLLETAMSLRNLLNPACT